SGQSINTSEGSPAPVHTEQVRGRGFTTSFSEFLPAAPVQHIPCNQKPAFGILLPPCFKERPRSLRPSQLCDHAGGFLSPKKIARPGSLSEAGKIDGSLRFDSSVCSR